MWRHGHACGCLPPLTQQVGVQADPNLDTGGTGWSIDPLERHEIQPRLERLERIGSDEADPLERRRSAESGECRDVATHPQSGHE